MTTPLRLGIAGLGTVGAGVVKIVERHAEMLSARAGRPISIRAVSARSRNRDRGIDLSAYAWEDDPVALAGRDDIDVFVELMGGEDGPAKAATEAAISAGKDVVKHEVIRSDTWHTKSFYAIRIEWFKKVGDNFSR